MKYGSQGEQLNIDSFRSSLEGLSKSNRWVQLGDKLPWDGIERLYNHRLNNGKRCAGNKPAFDPTLFVTIRKRPGINDFNGMGVAP